MYTYNTHYTRVPISIYSTTHVCTYVSIYVCMYSFPHVHGAIRSDQPAMQASQTLPGNDPITLCPALPCPTRHHRSTREGGLTGREGGGRRLSQTKLERKWVSDGHAQHALPESGMKSDAVSQWYPGMPALPACVPSWSGSGFRYVNIVWVVWCSDIHSPPLYDDPSPPPVPSLVMGGCK